MFKSHEISQTSTYMCVTLYLYTSAVNISTRDRIMRCEREIELTHIEAEHGQRLIIAISPYLNKSRSLTDSQNKTYVCSAWYYKKVPIFLHTLF